MFQLSNIFILENLNMNVYFIQGTTILNFNTKFFRPSNGIGIYIYEKEIVRCVFHTRNHNFKF
jgi:hypothetical protein